MLVVHYGQEHAEISTFDHSALRDRAHRTMLTGLLSIALSQDANTLC